MATRTFSQTDESSETFIQQNLLKNTKKEIFAFDSTDIAALRASGAFSEGTVFRRFDRSIRSDVASADWVCFPAYPFSLGLRYPFPEFMMQFFLTTGISFAQTMPMDIPIAYRLRSYGSSRFLLFSTSSKPLILKATKNEDGWQRKFFFFKRDSIYEGASLPDLEFPLYAAPAKIPEVFDLEELDSYSDHVQVKKEPSRKATASSNPSSSKAIIIPKPSPATKPRGLNSRKRKETDSPTISDRFPYENHGFIEASGVMTSFLNQGLERLVHLYQESCGLIKTFESDLKKAEATISDQGMIVAAKTQHYEDKFKTMSQEHQAALKKATREAQTQLKVVQAQHEQDMAT
ncbi:hypothetical protein Hanom_Chr03g00219361 [Helianthus anomalus]